MTAIVTDPRDPRFGSFASRLSHVSLSEAPPTLLLSPMGGDQSSVEVTG